MSLGKDAFRNTLISESLDLGCYNNINGDKAFRLAYTNEDTQGLLVVLSKTNLYLELFQTLYRDLIFKTDSRTLSADVLGFSG